MSVQQLHVVLVEPEIPQNTGNIGRLCLAVGARLHLVKPLGFDISDKAVRRAGLDYWQYLDVVQHDSTEELMQKIPPSAAPVMLTKKAGKTLFEHQFQPESWLFFGRETTGLPEWLLNRYAANCYRIPMKDARVRSLNLSNVVSISVYEAVRQLGL